MTDHMLSVQSSIEYIEKNLHEKIRLDDLAREACLSKFHYDRLFHETVGVTVNRFISRKRMEQAAKELTETDDSIIDIAFKYQYTSQEAFSRAFKRAYGFTPGKYRKVFADVDRNNIIRLDFRRSQMTAIAA